MLGARQLQRLRKMSGVAMVMWGLASCVMFIPDLIRGKLRESASFDWWLFLLFGVCCLVGGVVTLRQSH